ncbi:MAG: hypothetical protein PHI85_09750 [Victivallaceae bacterium]|nr:hypothetical protein [Victivallaceae bacterium]
MAFAELFPTQIDSMKIDRCSPEALALLDYEKELQLKNRAVAALLNDPAVRDITAAPVCPSPRPRFYRTTDKRRVSWRSGKLFFHMGRIPGRDPVADSQLEPREHLELYKTLHTLLSQPRNRRAAQELNYCIIRGSYEETALIFNVKTLSGEIVRSLRFVAEAAAKAVPSVRNVFIYVDETASDYYLEAERPTGKLTFKKLFGPECLALKISGRKILYPPTVFSQINESILPLFAGELSALMEPKPADTLIDLYCGYGLWSLLLAEHVGGVWGAEMSREAILAARDNAGFLFPAKRMHFESASISADFLRENLPAPRHENEIILIDPPRHGCFPGVLETLIARRPRKIFHLFCGADEVVPALKLYQANGCKIETLRPFDFFPGTLNIEMLAVVKPPALSSAK